MLKNMKCLTSPIHGFAGVPVCTQLNELKADIAIIGLHYLSPYPSQLNIPASNSAASSAADAIRLRSSAFIDHLDHYDFDFDDVLLADRQVRIADCGDTDKQANNDLQHPERITDVIRTILHQGAVPIAFGTDEGNFIPFARAYDGYDSICVIHIDAHIDWRDERNGVREGYSSVMRRVSEMPWVKSMAQIGLRGIGSARRQEIDDAISFGSVFIRAREVHREGIDACSERIPEADHYLITIDMDALDTAIAPGVLFPSPGGLTFEEITDLVQRISLKGMIEGIGLFELRPEKDIYGLTALTGVQLIINFIGALAHSGQIGR